MTSGPAKLVGVVGAINSKLVAWVGPSSATMLESSARVMLNFALEPTAAANYTYTNRYRIFIPSSNEL